MLTFCEKCGNVMVLEQRSGESLGNYKCRTCGFVKRMKLEKIQISEKIREEPEANLIPTRLKTPFKF
jgi:DNA-directed RNA polymerase subunit M/transcription elongation factor TFIIS